MKYKAECPHCRRAFYAPTKRNRWILCPGFGCGVKFQPHWNQIPDEVYQDEVAERHRKAWARLRDEEQN